MPLSAVTLEPSDVDIRPGTAEDAEFIVKTWLATQRHIYPNSYALDWAAKTEAAIADLLRRATVLVSAIDDRTVSYLVHQIAGRIFVVHFAYTDELARRQGMVRRMIYLANVGLFPVAFTHAPRNENVMRHLVTRYIFDPSLAP